MIWLNSEEFLMKVVSNLGKKTEQTFTRLAPRLEMELKTSLMRWQIN